MGAQSWGGLSAAGIAEAAVTRAAAASDSDLLLPVAATTVMTTPVVVITLAAALPLMIVIAIVNRPQKVIEGLDRDAGPLSARRRVREAEMNPQVDASL